MDKQTEQLLKDFYAAREVEAKDVLNENDIARQVKALRTPGGINTRKLIDYVERQLVPASLTTRNLPRGFGKEWAAEYDASVRAMAHWTRAHVAEGRRLALILEVCKDARAVLAHVGDFKDADLFAPVIRFWLSVKHQNLSLLYSSHPKSQADYYASYNFKLLVWGLCVGFYLGYAIDARGDLVRPKAKEILDPETALKNYQNARAVA